MLLLQRTRYLLQEFGARPSFSIVSDFIPEMPLSLGKKHVYRMIPGITN